VFLSVFSCLPILTPGNRNRTISSLTTFLGYRVTLNPCSRLSTLKNSLNYKQCQAAVLRSRPWFERKLDFRLFYYSYRNNFDLVVRYCADITGIMPVLAIENLFWKASTFVQTAMITALFGARLNMGFSIYLQYTFDFITFFLFISFILVEMLKYYHIKYCQNFLVRLNCSDLLM